MSIRLALLLTHFLSVFVTCSASAPTTSSGNITSPISNNITNVPHKQGWTAQPDGRGTIDILWSCAFTMFLCSWSTLCLNVPGSDDTPLKVFHRRFWLTALAFLGPEFIFQIAFGQWLSARRSVRDFRALGYPQWTMTHAFFADMGGFLLQTKDWTPFPIDAKQLHYLVAKGYIQFPTLEKRKIEDKNKVDGLLRLITICQIFWFVLNISGRAIQHLAITCLELTTAAFIVCCMGTMICWIHKPADVMVPEIIGTDVRIADILVEAGDDARQPYSRTPLDFVSRREWAWSLYWSNWINILRNMHIVFGPTMRPVNRIENTLSLHVPRNANLVMIGLTAIYSSIFIFAWNNEFPTSIEGALWRASSVTVLGTLFSYWGLTEFAFFWYPVLRQRFAPFITKNRDLEHGSRTRRWTGQNRLIRKARSVAACIRNNSVSNDPALTVPLKAILPIYITAVFYCHARTYILVEDLIELRALPPRAYTTIHWSGLIPHL